MSCEVHARFYESREVRLLPATHLVVFCESKADAELVLNVLNVWLAPRDLTLSEEKTHIVHLTEGFDFLGFNVRHYAYLRSRTGYKIAHQAEQRLGSAHPG